MQPTGNTTNHVARALNKQKANLTGTDCCLDSNKKLKAILIITFRDNTASLLHFIQPFIAIAGIEMTLKHVHTPSQVVNAILPAANVLFRYQQVTEVS